MGANEKRSDRANRVVRKPAVKFPHLRKRMEQRRLKHPRKGSL